MIKADYTLNQRQYDILRILPQTQNAKINFSSTIVQGHFIGARKLDFQEIYGLDFYTIPKEQQPQLYQQLLQLIAQTEAHLALLHPQQQETDDFLSGAKPCPIDTQDQCEACQ